MGATVSLIRMLVGLLFILSGLVKANDPLGLAYKMQEFFEVWNAGLATSSFFAKESLISFFHWLHGGALALAVVMITLEIVAGLALLIGWQKKAVLWGLLVLIVFFTFLTGHAWASGKFKNCGCFGDCLPISPLASFLKDVALLGAILFLFVNKKFIFPFATKGARGVLMAAALLATLFLQWYVLHYLPLVDCLPYKKGADIRLGMQIPPTAVRDSFAIRFVYQKEGKTFSFSPENLPPDLDTYTFVERTDKLIRKGNAEPAIKGFALSGVTDIDSTNIVLSQPYAVLYFVNGADGLSQKEKETFFQMQKAATQNSIPFYGVSTHLEPVSQSALGQNNLQTSFFKIDFTAYKTAARTNPTIYLLQNGTIRNKWSGRNAADAIKTIHSLQ